MSNIELAYEMMRIYKANQCDLYLVGGSVRDFIILGDFQDFDFATPCLIEESVKILNITKYDRFSAKFGTLKTKYQNQEVEITTFRKESDYTDLRHPDYIEFVKALAIDYQRRDFTINALYLDVDGKIHDPCHGQEDIQNKVIRCIGDSDRRVQEDPLRILRAIRFALRFHFSISPSLENSIRKYAYLVHEISEIRGKSEIQKMRKHNKVREIQSMFDQYNIDIKVIDYII